MWGLRSRSSRIKTGLDIESPMTESLAFLGENLRTKWLKKNVYGLYTLHLNQPQTLSAIVFPLEK